MKKKMSLFSKIYLSCIAGFLLLLIIASVVLWTVLDAFELAQPQHTAEMVFSEYFDANSPEKLLEIADFGNGFESNEVLVAAIESKLSSGELEYFSITSEEEGEEKYAVTVDGERIAYFTVTQTGETQGFGFKGYKLAGVEMFVSAPVTASVSVPKGYTLKLNGIEVSEDKISVADIPYKGNEFLPKEEEGKFFDKYTVDDFYVEPEVQVFDSDGKQVEAKKDDQTGEYTVSFAYDDELKEQYSERAIKIASLYTKVMSEDATKGQLYPYIDRKSDFYTKVKKSQTNWFWDHDGCAIKDTSATEFYKFSDNVFSCRVKLTQEMYLGNKTEVNKVDLVLYMKKIDGVYLLYNAVTNG